MKTEWRAVKTISSAETAMAEKLFNKEKFKANRRKIEADRNRKIIEARLKYGGGFDDELA